MFVDLYAPFLYAVFFLTGSAGFELLDVICIVVTVIFQIVCLVNMVKIYHGFRPCTDGLDEYVAKLNDTPEYVAGNDQAEFSVGTVGGWYIGRILLRCGLSHVIHSQAISLVDRHLLHEYDRNEAVGYDSNGADSAVEESKKLLTHSSTGENQL